MSTEVLSVVFSGLVALIGAVAAFTARRAARHGEELRALRAENRELRGQRRLADQYLGRVLRILDFRGITVPPPPEGLFDDVLDATAPLVDPDSAGAHRAAEQQ